VRNKAIAFSLGQNIADSVKPVLFIMLPILVLCVLLWYYLSSNDFTRLQRWATAGILGGGIGNIIDRIFRSEGVVDFISVKFYGLFGFERWPTFNVADSSVVVCCLLLFATIIIGPGKSKEKPTNE
jgi:signal peptidase II